MVRLDDGIYDVVVIDAHADGTDGTDGTRLELALVSGPSRGELVELRTHHLGRDPLSLLGLPGTLTVSTGIPSLSFEG